MKTSKRVISLVLAAIMLVTTFSIAMPMMKVEANAAITLGGITQTRVVSDYQTKYAEYANRFFGGQGKSEATNFVIPGLSSSNDYTPQGMTYWKAKDWILISAYDATGEGKHSVVYALDGKSTEFVALFKVLNQDGSTNTSHGGGIAASEYNFYYADTGSKISYIPLSEMDVAPGTVKEIRLKGSIDCAGELGGAATSYCCYDEGVLWTGNFYISSDEQYNTKAYEDYPSVLMGYKLVGNSSEEEWAYLNGRYKNLLNVSTSSGTGSANGSTLSWKAYKSGDMVDVVGTITAPSSYLGEYCPNYGSVYLEEGKKYIIQYETNVNPMLTDMYLFAPNGGGHMDFKMSYTNGGFNYTQIGDNKWHVYAEFTAGLRLPGADSSWPTTQSTNGTYTGTYTIRFDQDDIKVGESRQFAFTNISITEASDHLLDLNDDARLGYRGNHAGTVGDPTYCVLFSSSLDRVQYAMVDNGRIYISRSWSRKDSGNHIRELVVGEIDLNAPGTKTLTVNGKSRQCLYVDESKMTKFGGSYKENSADEKNQMFFMGEALCVMEGYLYMFAESAAWTYNGKTSDNACPEPIDVIWKIDQYAIMGELRETANEKSIYYERVEHGDVFANTSNSLLNTDEYIIVYRSAQKDPVTQKEILYALDAFGGQNGNKLAKNNSSMSENANGYSIGIVAHPITEYSMDGGKLYLNNPEKDDVENVRWKFNGAEGSLNYKIQSVSPYYANYKDLYFNGIKAYMTKDNSGMSIQLVQQDAPEGKWYLVVSDLRYLWVNDGFTRYTDTINKYYTDNNVSHTETPGTIHADALNMGGNVIGQSIIKAEYGYGQFEIYRRKLDPNTETENSKVYTNSKVELQPDGTYTIDLETYATNSTHYKLLDKQRPTDFILVLDASASMETNYDTGMTGWKRWSSTNELSIGSVTNEDDTSKPSSAKIHGYEYTTGNIFYRTGDGVYRQLYAAVRTTSRGLTSCKQSYWVYYKDDAGLCWVLCENGTIYDGITFEQLKSNVANDVNRSANTSSNSNGTRRNEVVWRGVHYSKNHSLTRLDVMKASVEALIDTIATESNTTGLKHRVAVVQYGSTAGENYYNTGMYKNDGSYVQYNGSGSISAANYTSAFFDVTNTSSRNKLKYSVIDGIESPEGTDPDTYSNHGYEMANNIVANYSGGYLADGDRSACIIMVTDGIPGQGKNDGNKGTVANEAITQAYNAKQSGAYSFTVQMGDSSGDWSDMTTYIDALSSEYIEAKSLTNLGDRNPNEVVYSMIVPTTSFNLNSLAKDLFINITANSRHALAQLSTSSVLRQTLSENFYAPADDGVGKAKVQYLVADGYYDGLGRISFKNETDATSLNISGVPGIETDANGNKYYKYLDVTGFDYKNYYISKNHEGGKKLIIRISGVLPRETNVNTGEELNLANAAISDDSWTGIYQNTTALSAKNAFKGFPNASFSIPKYTYVLDYGVAMYDSDVNGTLKSVSATLKAQRDASGNISYKSVSENGLVSITNNNLDLIYRSTPTNYADSGYCLIQRDDGTYDWFEIEVVPASNVLFEEDQATTTGTGVAWTKDGTTKAAYQSLTNEHTDVYGYDDVYADGANAHSFGSADKATVSNSAKRSATKTFDFIGEGIDLISACGENTGIMIVKISGGDLASPKAYIVDTYYGDSAVNGLLCQTPIVSFRGNHGTYTVEATAAYLSSAGAINKKNVTSSSLANGKFSAAAGTPVSDADVAELLAQVGMEDLASADLEMVWFDDNSILNGGTGAKGNVKTARDGSTVTSLNCYLDGFRIYHPMKHANDDYISSEKDAQYINVIDSLKNSYIGSGSTVLDKVAYVTGSLADGGALSFANYENVGPQNEIYLANGKSDALVLQVGLSSPESRVMLGLRAVTGTASVKIGGTQFNINSATEMYYDVTECVSVEGGVATITIQNTGSSLLAVNHIKLTGDATATLVEEEALEYAALSMAASPVMANVVNGVVTPATEDDTTEPDDGTITIPGGDVINKAPDFVQQLIAKVFEILSQIFSFLPVGEVM